MIHSLLKNIKIIPLVVFVLLSIQHKNYASKIHFPEINLEKFVDYNHFKNNGQYPNYHLGDTLRIKLQIPNIQKDIALYIGNAEYISVQHGDSTLYIGKYAPKHSPYTQKLSNCTTIPEYFKGKIVDITCYNYIARIFFLAPHVVNQRLVHLNQEYTYKMGERGSLLLVMFLGGVLFFATYCYLSHYQDRKNSEYLYLGIHMTGMLIFTYIQSDGFFQSYRLFPNNPIIYHQLYDGSLLLSYIGFLLLMRDFLDLKKLSPKINKLTTYIIIYLTIGAFILFMFASNYIFPSYHKILNIIYTIAFVLSFIHNKLILESEKIPYKYFAIIGNIILLFFLFIEFSFVQFGDNDKYYWDIKNPLFYEFYTFNIAQIGNFIFLMFHAMSIGIKRKSNERKLFKFRSAEIQKLAEDEKKKIDYIRKMKQKEADQKSELEKFDFLFNQSKTQFGMFKGNINPKFIQNNIDVINQKILNDYTKDHRWHISKFAELLKNSIELSHYHLIPISKEIENINLYIELEELRTNQELKNSLVLDYNLVKSNNFVPPFVLQEFIEFCVWNILYIKRSNNKILIKFSKLEKDLLAIIHIQGKLNNIFLDNYKLNNIFDRINSKIHYAYSFYEEQNFIQYDRTIDMIQLTISFPQRNLKINQ